VRAAAFAALLPLCAVITGCGNDWTVSLYVQSDPPIDAQLASDRVTMAEGIAVGVLARAFDDGEMEDDETIELLSQNSGVLDVRPGLNPNEFVLIARSPGRTTIDAFVDDEAATPIEVVVTAQGAGP
jgi:hypothetical protein